MTDDNEQSLPGTDPTSELIVAFARRSQALFVAGGVDATLQAVVDLAVATIEACDFAGIFLRRAGEISTPVRTDPLVAEVDELQLRAAASPGLDAIAGEASIYAEDLAVDPRWPDFGPAASAMGIRSLLSLRLAADGALGSLNLYARYPSAFGVVDRARGLVLAGLAGVALALAHAHEEDLRHAEQLRQALGTRELIGQAQGILMERERITADEAFDILRRASQHLNIKLCEVAQDLVDTGERPETGLSSRPEGPSSPAGK